MHRTEKTLAKLLAFSKLKDGWFYGSGIGFDTDSILKAVNLIAKGVELDYENFDVAPGENGEIQVISYAGAIRCEITIEPNGVVEILFERNNEQLNEPFRLDFETALFVFDQQSRILCAGLGISKEVNISNWTSDLQVSLSKTARMVEYLSYKKIASMEVAEPSVNTYGIIIPIAQTNLRYSGYSRKPFYRRIGNSFLTCPEAIPAITT
jgi:hypothetical protein